MFSVDCCVLCVVCCVLYCMVTINSVIRFTSIGIKNQKYSILAVALDGFKQARCVLP